MTSHTHSPFHVVEEFLSPASCETLINQLGIKVPSIAEDERPLKHERFITDPQALELLQTNFLEHAADIQAQYRGIIKPFDNFSFIQYFEDPQHPCEPHGCESSKFIRKKWVKTKDVDIVGYIWLKDFGNGVPLDPRHEVYGGKLEFPAYNFSLVPQRGTMVLFPAGPHFITAISPALIGSLEQVKFSFKLSKADGGAWQYQPSEFSGTYQDWF